MRHAVVAVAQQRLRVYRDLASYRQGVERFFRLAESKHARLLVFPERTALMVVPPLLEGFRSNLAKEAGQTEGKRASLWRRARGKMLRGVARLVGSNLAEAVMQTLEEVPEIVWQQFTEIFARLAYEYKVTVVAGSGYFLDPDTRERRHLAAVFGPDGDILGIQGKVLLSEADQAWAQPAAGWQVIETPVGRLGITFGEEVLYPEVGRWLAYQGADAIITLAAARDVAVATQVKDGLWARVMDNQVFGALACTVGTDPFQPLPTPTYKGRSALLAPHGLTPGYNGVLVEAGTPSAEVLVTAQWDFEKLHHYWEAAPIPVRRRTPGKGTGRVLAAVYSQELSLEEARRRLPTRGPATLPVKPADVEADRKREAPAPRAAPETEETPHVVAWPPEEPGEAKVETPPEMPAAEPQAELQAPSEAPESSAPAEPEKEEDLTLADVLAQRSAPATEAVSQATEEEIPESLWNAVKNELERAATVLRSLTSGERPPTPKPEKPSEEAPSRGGWFQQMVQRAQHREMPEKWEEF